MGTSQDRRKRFFLEHPTCCFCGGVSMATTIDHTPPRTLFSDRKSPTGYTFPACDSCNYGTKEYEEVLSMLCRTSPGGLISEGDLKQFQNALDAIGAKRPEVLSAMVMTTHEIRAFVRRIKEFNPNFEYEGLLSDLPIVKIDHPYFHNCVLNFARKLVIALHYKHTRRILPPSGRVSVSWYTNDNRIFNEIPIINAPFSKAAIQFNSTPIDHQFSYDYAVTNNQLGSLYAVLFREAVTLYCFVLENPGDRVLQREQSGRRGVTVFPPFSPSPSR